MSDQPPETTTRVPAEERRLGDARRLPLWEDE